MNAAYMSYGKGQGEPYKQKIKYIYNTSHVKFFNKILQSSQVHSSQKCPKKK